MSKAEKYIPFILVVLFALFVVGIIWSPAPDNNVKFTDQVQTSIKGVVYIGCPQWQGSGFIISDHVVVTAGHIVEGVEDFEITTNSGKIFKASRAISDKEHDVAFIWVDEVLPDPVRIGSIKDCVLGQNVYVIGSPYGKMNFNSLTVGVISGVNRDWSLLGENYGWNVAFTIDSAGHPGNSGCPVFTADGVVRGILVGGRSPVLINVMPCDLFLSDLEEIELMFTIDRYRFEEATPVWDEFYNYKDDNETKKESTY
ncbi:hypothetical protein LCGC14_1577710 [marine sediment metagenome]|uniref:Serine protease n=1 Tax=marine sediment metagenome TaxID=412755 RepID=A0A0F9KYR2_9ZZZZ